MMFILIISNIIVAIILGILNLEYLYSFEIAFFGSMFVIYSSYKSICRKIQNYTFENNAKNDDDEISKISKKDKIFMGLKVSFGIFRILSYAFVCIGIIALINNKLFFIIPYVLGVSVCSLAMAFVISKSLNS